MYLFQPVLWSKLELVFSLLEERKWRAASRKPQVAENRVMTDALSKEMKFYILTSTKTKQVSLNSKQYTVPVWTHFLIQVNQKVYPNFWLVLYLTSYFHMKVVLLLSLSSDFCPVLPHSVINESSHKCPASSVRKLLIHDKLRQKIIEKSHFMSLKWTIVAPDCPWYLKSRTTHVHSSFLISDWLSLLVLDIFWRVSISSISRNENDLK